MSKVARRERVVFVDEWSQSDSEREVRKERRTMMLCAPQNGGKLKPRTLNNVQHSLTPGKPP